MTVVMRLLDMPGMPAKTGFEGKYLKEYDPTRDGHDERGRTITVHIVATEDITEAKRYTDVVEMWEDWKRVDPRTPVRPDGRPNRPLSAFTITPVTV